MTQAEIPFIKMLLWSIGLLWGLPLLLAAIITIICFIPVKKDSNEKR